MRTTESQLSKIALFALALTLPVFPVKARQPAAKAENPGVLLADAFSAWTDGRPEDAAGTLKYVVLTSSESANAVKAARNLSAVLASLGKSEEALPYIEKWKILSSSDPYAFIEEGWHLLALEKYLEAERALNKALTLTADAALTAQIKFLLAYCENHLAGPEQAIKDFQDAYYDYPYLVPVSSLLIGRLFVRTKKRQHAVPFLKQALEYDSRNFQAMVDMARLYSNVNYLLQAWQSFYILFELDPKEKYFAKMKKKLARSVPGDKNNLLYWTRLSWPVHQKPLEKIGSKRIRIALYADRDGKPATLEKFYFAANTPFRITDSVLGKVTEGKSNEQWEIRYNSRDGVYEVRNNAGILLRKTRNKLTIIPERERGVVLVKSPRFLVPETGIDRGDKELAGRLKIIPRSGGGFMLVNDTHMENCVSPITAFYAKGGKNKEEMKAVAVVVRTRLLHLFYTRDAKNPYYDITDSEKYIRFPGMQAENRVSISAAKATLGEVLYLGGSLAKVDMHEACGGLTAEGVNDNTNMPSEKSPFALYSWTIHPPPENLYCLPYDKTYASSVYWQLLLDAEWIENRANREYKTGNLRAVVPLKRDSAFRVKSLRIEGSAKTVVISSEEEISRVLSAGAIRSMRFDIRPLRAGTRPEAFLLRGFGTGDGRGLCLWGTRKLAENYGKKYKVILRHYFPRLSVKKIKL